jgi:hypothetical protein
VSSDCQFLGRTWLARIAPSQEPDDVSTRKILKVKSKFKVPESRFHPIGYTERLLVQDLVLQR